MDREMVRRKLKALREKRFPVIKDFVSASKIHDANVRTVEDPKGTGLPTLPNLEKWLRVCGVTLSQFFSEIEAAERGGKEPPPEHPLMEQARALISRDVIAADALATMLEHQAPKPIKRKRHR